MAERMPARTKEQWWTAQGNAVKWRKASKREQRCSDCGATIAIGERYFDTGELVDPPWTTAKLCSVCAGRSRFPLPNDVLHPGELCPGSFASNPENHTEPISEGWGVCTRCGEVVNLRAHRAYAGGPWAVPSHVIPRSEVG